MKKSEVEAIIASILDDKFLINHVYTIVRSKLSNEWKNDIHWCNAVINYAIEHTLDDLSLVDLVKSLKRKHQLKGRNKKSMIVNSLNSMKNDHNTPESKDNPNFHVKSNVNKRDYHNPVDISRTSSEVKPNFSSTEPIQITTSPGRRHKNFASGEVQKLPSTHRIKKLSGKLAQPASVDDTSKPVNDHDRSIFGENENSALEVSEVIAKGISSSNDDQVLIKMSHEGDNMSEASSIVEYAEELNPLPHTHHHHHSISVDSNDSSDRSHMMHKAPRDGDNEDYSHINQVVEPIEEAYEEAYDDDFEEVNNSVLSKLPIATWVPNLIEHAHDVDDSHISERKVEFSNPVVTVINERDKCSKDEVGELFYTHDESIKFENDYAKELEKAEVLGLSWNDWIVKRTDEDVTREEEEEGTNSYMEDVEDEDVWGDDEDDVENGYDDEVFETYPNVGSDNNGDPYADF